MQKILLIILLSVLIHVRTTYAAVADRDEDDMVNPLGGTIKDDRAFVDIFRDDVTLEEQLLYAVYPVIQNNTATTSIGTSFVVKFDIRDVKDEDTEFLITNKHVLEEDNDEGETRFVSDFTTKITVFRKDNGKLERLNLRVWIEPKYIYQHPTEDVCAIPFKMVKEAFKALDSAPIFNFPYISIGENLFADQTYLKEFVLVCDNVLMVGYPNGFYDEANNYPLFRRGMISSPPAVDFRSRPHIMIDIPSYEGNSGSPIIHTPADYDRKGVLVVGRSHMKKLIGINVSGPYTHHTVVADSEDDSDKEGIGKVRMLYNLGRIIKITALDAIKASVVAKVHGKRI